MDLLDLLGNVQWLVLCTFMSFTLPGLLPWHFRIVLIGQHVVLEASSESQSLSTILEPGSSRIRRGYELIQSPQCALINDCPAWVSWGFQLVSTPYFLLGWFLISRKLASEDYGWVNPIFWEQMVTLLGSTLMSDCVRRSGIVRWHSGLITRWPTNVRLAATVDRVGLAVQPPPGPRHQRRGVNPVNRTIGENSVH